LLFEPTRDAIAAKSLENLVSFEAVQFALNRSNKYWHNLRGSELRRFDGQFFRAFLRSERLTGHEVFRQNRLRTDQVVELILTHFFLANVNGPLLELLRAGLDEGFRSSLAFVDQLFELSLCVGYGRVLDLI